jgi:PAS domain-containing protein
MDGVVYFASRRARKLDATAISQLETLARTILVVLSRARERHAGADVRKRMRTQLEMLDEAPAGITLNTQGRFVYANTQAAAMHGPDDALRIAVVAERPSCLAQLLRECRVGHRAITPQRRIELALVDRSIAMGQQQGDQIEDLGFDIDNGSATADLARIKVDQGVAGAVTQRQ